MNRDIAIIGMAGMFPQAQNLSQFYHNLKNGKDSVRPLSRRRKANTTIPDHRDYQVLAYIEDIDLFDYQFFKISLGEAQHMDPKQRLLLQVVYQTFENAGYNIDHFNGSNTSVYVGDTNLDYYKHIEEFNPTVITGNLNGLTAGRISRLFNLRGNAQMIDTACSSSLVALHQACNDLILGESDCSLVCGVNLSLFPMHRREKFHDLDIVSPSGKARSFSAEADGTGGGEAVISVLLKPLQKALDDKDIIHAIIKSTAVNQDANLSSSITAPDSIAQSEVIKAAWKKANINPETITYIEAHGTGTKLGDPIEVEGLDLAFKTYTNKKKICAISSVKSNIGHTDSAAGLTGLIKAVLSIKNKELFPSLHFKNPNPFIDFENSAVYVNSTLKHWTVENQTNVRRAGVSSFGLTGTNCHVVLEEALEREVTVDNDFAQPILVSAKTSNSLKDYLKTLASFLRENPGSSLLDISFTLAAGRKHYPFRYAVCVENKEDLLEQLDLADSQSEFKKVNEVSPKTIFVFSNQIKYSEKVMNQLLIHNTFRSEFEKCFDISKIAENCPNLFAFAFQYAFYKLLENTGITTQFLIGDGVGKLVIAALKGSLTLEEALSQSSAKTETSSDLSSRLEKMIEKESAGIDLVFGEMGIQGDVTDALAEIKSDKFGLVRIPENNGLKSFAKDLYLNNHPIDWFLFLNEEGGRKIELPTYRFAKTRCWIKEPLENKVEEWFYNLEWVEKDLTEINEVKNNNFLVFSENEELTQEIVKLFGEKANTCITVKPGNTFNKISENKFEIDRNDENNYQKLAINFVNRNLDGIIDLQDFEPSPQNVETDFEISNKIKPKLYLSRAFNNYFNKKNFSVSYVTANAKKVNRASQISPLNSLSSAFVKSLLTEHITLKVSSVDFTANETSVSVAKKVYNEISSDELVRVVSYRGEKRYVQNLTNLKLPFHAKNDLYSDGDVYIVSGGAGGIAFEMCKSIAKENKSHFIILGRTLPSHSGKLDKLKCLELSGSSFEYHCTDISNKELMQKIFADVATRVQKVKGVIHAAGVPGKIAPIKDKTLKDFEEVLSPKVQGTIILDECTKFLNPDFFVCFSSLGAYVPHKNMADYVMANAFEDAYSISKEGDSTKYISINWPGWVEVGMSVKEGEDVNYQYSPLAPMYVEDGVKAFKYALQLEKTNVAIANINVEAIGINPFFIIKDDRETTEEVKPLISESLLESIETEDSNSVLGKVSKIWYDVLKSDHIDFEDDFFEIGGHSLNGAQVLNRVKREFGLDMEIDDLFEYSTINLLSKKIEELLVVGDIELFEAIEPTPEKEYYDVSYAQKGLWLLNQIADGIKAFNMPGAFRFKGILDKSALEKSFIALIDRHESLRTTFVIVDGEVKQKVHSVENSGFKLQYKDLREVQDRDLQLEKSIYNEATSIFDLEKGPLLRAQLIQLAEDQFVFLMTMHHIISDGWSMAVFQKDLQSLYQAFSQVRPNPLAPLKIQYRDYVAWQHLQLSGDKYEVHKNYWLSKFDGEISSQELPIDYPRKAYQTFNGKRLYFTIDNILILEIKKRCSEANATLFMFLLAIVKTLIWKFSGISDIIIGSPIAGRNHQDLENQIGYYLNALALRTKVNGAERFKDFLSKVKDTTIEAFQHDVYPFELLKEDLNLDNQFPLFRVLIMLQNTQGIAGKENKPENLKIDQMTVNYQASKFDLSFDFTESEDELGGVIEYNTDLFSEETILKLKDSFLQIAGKVSNDIEVEMSDTALEIAKSKLEEEKFLSFTMSIDDFIE